MPDPSSISNIPSIFHVPFDPSPIDRRRLGRSKDYTRHRDALREIRFRAAVLIDYTCGEVMRGEWADRAW